MHLDEMKISDLKELMALVRGKTRKQSVEDQGGVRIVILQRGWVMVGVFFKQGTKCWLEKASVIRNWGTSKGLGEITMNGPTLNTKLDPCNGRVDFHELTIIASIKCEDTVWSKHLK